MTDKNITVGDHSVVITNMKALPPGSHAIGAGAIAIGYGTFDDALRHDLIEFLEEQIDQMKLTWMHVFAIAYSVWVLLIFAYEKLDKIVNKSAKLSALQDRLEGLLKPERSRK